MPDLRMSADLVSAAEVGGCVPSLGLPSGTVAGGFLPGRLFRPMLKGTASHAISAAQFWK